MIEIDYTKKPSAPTLRAAIRKAIAGGSNSIEFSWGENRINLEQYFGHWVGIGWIGCNSGQYLANELNIGGK